MAAFLLVAGCNHVGFASYLQVAGSAKRQHHVIISSRNAYGEKLQKTCNGVQRTLANQLAGLTSGETCKKIANA